MNAQQALQSVLFKRFSELKARNGAYSVRAFAKRLGLSAAATNEILKGERNVSEKLAQRILLRLQMDPSERAQILSYFERKASQSARSAPSSQSLKLSSDQFRTISDWVHFAIMSLIKTKGFKADPVWISQRLGVTESRVSLAIDRLLRLGLITRSGKRGFKRTEARIQTSDDVLDVSIQRAHIEDMELAKAAILELPVTVRDFTSITIPVNLESIPSVKEAIRRAQDEIADLLTKGQTTEVYRLCSYLFPLTKGVKHET